MSVHDLVERDPRLTAARRDLAASALRGLVDAERFTDGERYVVRDGVLDMKRLPRSDAPVDTQLLYGDAVTVYEESDGWGWAQAERDDYVGYVAMRGLVRPAATPTHRVIVARTHVYPAPDMKQPTIAALPLGGLVAVGAARGGFVTIDDFGYIFAAHLAPLAAPLVDPVAVAERLIGSPYLWGGKSALGIDCSGLVQVSFALCDHAMPRDTDMQEALGEPVAIDESLAGLERGDLVFWKGHVGLMADATALVHANAFHMLVIKEPLREARDRIAASSGLPIRAIRRPANR